MSKPTIVALLLVLGVAVVPGLAAQTVRPCTVERVIDGDTFECAAGERVRLLLVNAPEMGDAPLGGLAREFVRGIVPAGTRVGLELDVRERDRYGRILAHVHLPDGRSLNRVLARRGFARVMVIPPNVKHVETMRAAADSARAEGAGLWGVEGFGEGEGAEPLEGAEEETGADTRGREEVGGNCHPSYPDVCIPPPPPDLNCGDVPHRRFRVVGADPHGFDRDRDGVGCERGLAVRGGSPSPSQRSRDPGVVGADDRSRERPSVYAVYKVNGCRSEPR